MLVSKKKFAELTGIRTNHIATLAKRGNIIVEGNGQIDIDNETNKYFYLKKKDKEPDPEINIPTEESNGLLGMRELDRIKKSLDIQKATEEIELLKIKKEKAQGIVIPLDLTKDLFSRHIKNMVVEFDNASDRILTMISSKHRLSNEDVAKYRGQIKKEINRAVGETTEATKKEISIIVNEFAEKRGVGEKE